MSTQYYGIKINEVENDNFTANIVCIYGDMASELPCAFNPSFFFVLLAEDDAPASYYTTDDIYDGPIDGNKFIQKVELIYLKNLFEPMNTFVGLNHFEKSDLPQGKYKIWVYNPPKVNLEELDYDVSDLTPVLSEMEVGNTWTSNALQWSSGVYDSEELLDFSLNQKKLIENINNKESFDLNVAKIILKFGEKCPILVDYLNDSGNFTEELWLEAILYCSIYNPEIAEYLYKCGRSEAIPTMLIAWAIEMQKLRNDVLYGIVVKNPIPIEIIAYSCLLIAKNKPQESWIAENLLQRKNHEDATEIEKYLIGFALMKLGIENNWVKNDEILKKHQNILNELTI